MTPEKIAEAQSYWSQICELHARHGLRFALWVVRATDVECIAHLSMQQMKAIVRTWNVEDED